MAAFKSFLLFALLALIFAACVAASERQSLFADQAQLAGHALPQRFQEMIQRRRLAQSGSYGRYGTYGVYGR
jgi:hypothetical protein